MNNNILYLQQILNKYKPKNLTFDFLDIGLLHTKLKEWAGFNFLGVISSGSLAKGTATSLGSDIDYLVSLKNDSIFNTGGLLGDMYNSLSLFLISQGYNVKVQNVSVRVTLPTKGLLTEDLLVDVTPARKHPGHTNDHSLYISKTHSWQKTNIAKHIKDISESGRTDVIRLLKIWRELNKLDFPSIYLEYLIVNHILLYEPKDVDNLLANFVYVLDEFSQDYENPLFLNVIDPANSSNKLSDLMSSAEKEKIVACAKSAMKQQTLSTVIW